VGALALDDAGLKCSFHCKIQICNAWSAQHSQAQRWVDPGWKKGGVFYVNAALNSIESTVFLPSQRWFLVRMESWINRAFERSVRVFLLLPERPVFSGPVAIVPQIPKIILTAYPQANLSCL
jgi:hypothetical protein